MRRFSLLAACPKDPSCWGSPKPFGLAPKHGAIEVAVQVRPLGFLIQPKVVRFEIGPVGIRSMTATRKELRTRQQPGARPGPSQQPIDDHRTYYHAHVGRLKERISKEKAFCITGSNDALMRCNSICPTSDILVADKRCVASPQTRERGT